MPAHGSSRAYRIAVLPGDGIGPEVTQAMQRVLDPVAHAHGFRLDWTAYPVGGAALDTVGVPLPEATLAACRQADAVFLGAVGGPAWDDRAGAERPEAGLLQLRKALGVYANLRPVAVPAALTDASPLKADRIAGVDLLVVRELTGGIYFGPSAQTAHSAQSTMVYHTEEIERVAHVAFQWAARRRGHVTSVDKANVLAVSRHWRTVVTDLHRQQYPDLTLTHLYVDNAAMQLVQDPRQFDVLLTGNLFGDILSDLAAALPGSLGLLPSASLGGKVGLFEPVHGSAPDLVGTGRANPIAAILSGAMLLEALGQPEAAAAVRGGVDRTLNAGYRTADLAPAGAEAVSTTRMADLIAQHAAEATVSFQPVT